MAHSFISSFTSEAEAFQAYADTFPDRTILLLDTYDTIEGARKAVKVAKNLEHDGHRLVAVRLDSGDFESLSRQVREILDDAGLDYVQILASGGLDEFELDDLVQAGAPIDLFGVGTKVGVSADAPWSDMAYKLVCYDGRPVMKLSTGKVSLPGAKQVFRVRDDQGQLSHDIIGLDHESLPQGEPLLEQVMSGGAPTGPASPLDLIKERLAQDLQDLDAGIKRIRHPDEYPVSVSPALEELRVQVEQQVLSAQ